MVGSLHSTPSSASFLSSSSRRMQEQALREAFASIDIDGAWFVDWGLTA
jgi:hypothetical protein